MNETILFGEKKLKNNSFHVLLRNCPFYNCCLTVLGKVKRFTLWFDIYIALQVRLFETFDPENKSSDLRGRNFQGTHSILVYVYCHWVCMYKSTCRVCFLQKKN